MCKCRYGAKKLSAVASQPLSEFSRSKLLLNKMVRVSLAVVLLATQAVALSFVPQVQRVYSDVLDVFNLDPKPLDTPSILYTYPGPDEKPVPGDSPINQCDVSTPQILILQSVDILPNPPLKGQNLTFSAVGTTLQDIKQGAYVEVDVRYGFIKLIHQTYDLCEEITKVDLECPIKKGLQKIKKTVEIPNEVPPGRYVVYARAYTKDDVFITCLTTTIDFT